MLAVLWGKSTPDEHLSNIYDAGLPDGRRHKLINIAFIVVGEDLDPIYPHSIKQVRTYISEQTEVKKNFIIKTMSNVVEAPNESAMTFSRYAQIPLQVNASRRP